MLNAGNFVVDSTVYLIFNTYNANGASVTVTNLVAGDVKIYKDGGTTERDNANGVTVSINHDGKTGKHLVSIDLSDDTDAGFYAPSSDYQVELEGITVATQTINAWAGMFSIQNRFMLGTDGANTTTPPTVDEVRDGILDDATRFSGADIDAAITSRAVAGDNMNLADDAITPAKYNAAAANIPYQGGIWVDSGAANINAVVGVDGLPSNPVSTLVAARTLADAIGIKKYYITNSSSLALAATHQNWEFVGLGRASSILSLGGRDVDNSEFRNLSITGLQGGANLIQMVSCLLTSLSALKIWARKCCLSGDITIAAGSMFIFDQCLSAVAGAATPVLTFSAGATTVQFRHYSGGLEVKSMTSDHTMSYETDGQLIVNTNCISGVISARGNMSITDNGTTMNITKDAVWNTSQGVQSVTDDVGITQVGADKVFGSSGAVIAEPSAGAPPATPKPGQFLQWLWAHFRNKGTLNKTTGEAKIYNDAGAEIAKGTDSDDGTTFIKGELGAP